MKGYDRGLKAVVLVHAHHQVQQHQLILLPHLGHHDELAESAGEARNLSATALYRAAMPPPTIRQLPLEPRCSPRVLSPRASAARRSRLSLYSIGFHGFPFTK